MFDVVFGCPMLVWIFEVVCGCLILLSIVVDDGILIDSWTSSTACLKRSDMHAFAFSNKMLVDMHVAHGREITEIALRIPCIP